MNKMVKYYHQLVDSLMEKVKSGELPSSQLISHDHKEAEQQYELTTKEADLAHHSFLRDLRTFFLQRDNEDIILLIDKESFWKELAKITDKTQVEWQEMMNDLHHHGIYKSGEVVGLGKIFCERCHFEMDFAVPEILPRCPECNYDKFYRKPLEP